MAERFVESTGTISVTNGASTVVGTDTLFSGRDRAGASVWACPASGVPIKVGTVAEVDPRGTYDNLSLPLVHAFEGTTLTDVDFELVDGLALASGATQAAIFARFAAFLEQNAGLTFNQADTINFALVPNNSLFIDSVTRSIYQWRDGVLETVYNVGLQFVPRGAYAGGTTYAKNDLVQSGSYIYVSNADGNVGNMPDATPASDAHWTYVPVATVQQVLDALGVHSITISSSDPSGGVDGDLWFKV